VQYISDVLTLKEVFLLPLRGNAAVADLLPTLLSLVEDILQVCRATQLRLFECTRDGWSRCGPATALLTNFPAVAAAHSAYAKLHASAVRVLVPAWDAQAPSELPARCHGWNLLEFLNTPLARLAVISNITVDLITRPTPHLGEARAARELVNASAAAAAMVASVVAGDTLSGLRMRFGAVACASFGGTFPIRVDSFLVRGDAAWFGTHGVQSDVCITTDRCGSSPLRCSCIQRLLLPLHIFPGRYRPLVLWQHRVPPPPYDAPMAHCAASPAQNGCPVQEGLLRRVCVSNRCRSRV
jgi:hypothetical protein